MNYTEAIQYIHSVNWMFCNPGLDRVKTLCKALGNPQDSLKFIHVAGTNGKGSFCSMLDSVLRAQGYRVGLFTSPYIMEFGERMRVDGNNIADDELCVKLRDSITLPSSIPKPSSSIFFTVSSSSLLNIALT